MCLPLEVVEVHVAITIVARTNPPDLPIEFPAELPRTRSTQVVHAVDMHAHEGFTLESLTERENLPFILLAIALAFLKERGIVETRCRRNYAATQCTHLDAMTQYCALADNG